MKTLKVGMHPNSYQINYEYTTKLFGNIELENGHFGKHFTKMCFVHSTTEAIFVWRYFVKLHLSLNDLNCGFNGGYLVEYDALSFFIFDLLQQNFMVVSSHRNIE